MDDRDMLNAKVRKSVEDDLQAVIPQDRPGDFNQALMELGATVCIPNGMPKCGECPWKDSCKAHIQSKETDFPKKAPKKIRTVEKKTILIIQDAVRTAIRKPVSYTHLDVYKRQLCHFQFRLLGTSHILQE